MKAKANIFNNFFPKQCTRLENDSKLPSNQIFLTQSRLSSLDFNEDKFLKIIRTLNIHKVHGHDDISIRVIKICDKSLLKPLIILFRNSTKSSHYPDIWKTSNIIPVQKKNDKQLVKTTNQYLFCLFLENYLNKLYSMEFITFCCRRN